MGFARALLPNNLARDDYTDDRPGRDGGAAGDLRLRRQLDAAVNHAMTAAGVPGAIIGIWGPDGDYVRAFGVADKNTRAPMKADFYSRIGSVTKTFTVTAVLQLADQG